MHDANETLTMNSDQVAQSTYKTYKLGKTLYQKDSYI